MTFVGKEMNLEITKNNSGAPDFQRQMSHALVRQPYLFFFFFFLRCVFIDVLVNVPACLPACAVTVSPFGEARLHT